MGKKLVIGIAVAAVLASCTTGGGGQPQKEDPMAKFTAADSMKAEYVETYAEKMYSDVIEAYTKGDEGRVNTITNKDKQYLSESLLYLESNFGGEGDSYSRWFFNEKCDSIKVRNLRVETMYPTDRRAMVIFDVEGCTKGVQKDCRIMMRREGGEWRVDNFIWELTDQDANYGKYRYIMSEKQTLQDIEQQFIDQERAEIEREEGGVEWEDGKEGGEGEEGLEEYKSEIGMTWDGTAVTTPGALLAAIETEPKVVEIAEGVTLNLTELLEKTKGVLYARVQSTGTGLVLNEMGAITIKGLGKGAKIVIDDQQSDVLYLRNCTGIKIENLTLGHTGGGAEEGGDGRERRGTAINITDSKNIEIEKCELSSSGSVGVSAYNTENLRVKNTLIKDCADGGTIAIHCKHVTFKHCEITKCGRASRYLIKAYEGEGLTFEDCLIHRNDNDEVVFDVNYKTELENCDVGTDGMLTDGESVEFVKYNENSMFGCNNCPGAGGNGAGPGR
ncbi:MAG: right-handed parallel beta-helix repeat-containing protein [Bacteroidales bacterium]|nr:right-handed parallel beta-helix repeat-containing protein [Bacteroidales bacterium]